MTVFNRHFSEGEGDGDSHARLKRQAAVASMAVALLLIIFKFAAFLATNSVSILSSLMDSLFDALASLVALVSITQASTPADRDHRFGHGKIEALGALAQSLFVLGSGILLFVESIRRFVTPQAVSEPALGIYVMILSIVLTGALITFQRHVIKKTQSVAVAADHVHYTGDLLMNFSVLVALLLNYFTSWPYFDPLFAIMIAVRLLYGAYQISLKAADILLDKELPDHDRATIKGIVKSHVHVRGIHDLRTRNTGDRVFIEFHMEVDPQMAMTDVHDVMDDVEETLFTAFPKSEVLIHPEPEGIDDFRLDRTLKK